MPQPAVARTQTFRQTPRLKLVVSRKYPRTDEEAIRPYRIWDSVQGKDLAHRCYGYERHAFNSALLMMFDPETKAGRTLEVYDIRTGKWLCTFRREEHSIAFTR